MGVCGKGRDISEVLAWPVPGWMDPVLAGHRSISPVTTAQAGSVSRSEQVPGLAALFSEGSCGGVLFPWALLLCADVLFGFTLLFYLQIKQLTSLSFRVLQLCAPRVSTVAKLRPCL